MHQSAVSLEFDWSFFDSQVIGKDHGVSKEELEKYSNQAEKVWKKLIEDKERSQLAFWNILENDLVLAEIRNIEQVVRKKDWENVILLGIGGSALGAMAIFRALRHPFHNLEAKPRLFIMDNIDPVTFLSLLDMINWERTLVIAISKSGTTAETMSQFLIVLDRIKKKLGASSVRDQVIVITDPEKGILRSIARSTDIPSCSVPPLLGGRFSVLSPVGLVPALCVGVDIEMLWQGAVWAAKRAGDNHFMDNPSVKMGLYQFIFDSEKKKPIHVYWAYSDALYPLSDWIRQLIAESLGKKRADGTSVGITPIKALGVTDQHSQLQLYREGPNDKVIIFLGVKSWERDVEIPSLEESVGSLEYLGGHTLGELFHAEQRATACALAEAGRPNMTLWFPVLNAFTLGQAFFMFELQTAFMGGLYGINPFDQPGVELSKLMTYGLMGRKGFEEYAAIVEKFGSWKR
ncbi:MAG: glucose-6-phosphate isomerase [Syntrophobacterales bacterium]|nr:glucose-6-phosphate isomerase [Syntrophobacterales bacterium]